MRSLIAVGLGVLVLLLCYCATRSVLARARGSGLARWRTNVRPERVAVVMVAVNFEPATVTKGAWARYCERHGYDFVCLDRADYDDASIGIAWWRVRLVHDLLAGGRYRAVMHVDADTVPVLPEVSVDDWMDARGTGETACYLSADKTSHGHSFGSVNFGVHILKRDTFCRDLLRRMWRQRYIRTKWPREQGCIEDELSSLRRHRPDLFDLKVDIAPYGEWQSFVPREALEGGSWVFHAAGWKQADMKAAFEQVLRRTTPGPS